jgi:hypothetical protein
LTYRYKFVKTASKFLASCFSSLFSRPKMVGGSLANSVSFRHGTNVEFEGPSFVGGVPVPPGQKVSVSYTALLQVISGPFE